MTSLDRIADMLAGENAEIIRTNRDTVAEIRLRANRPVYVALLDGREVQGEPLNGQMLRSIINQLMDNSLYSRENELRHGYFTTRDGFRVGICGKINVGSQGIDHLVNISSACIRIPREVKGSAHELAHMTKQESRHSVLIVSPPGLGKTTMLRDYIRILSDGGMNVGLADERREIACCLEGIPQLDVGCRTDVMDNCPKHLALSMMIRACTPHLVAADEIGSADDAHAIMDAKRCGVAVAASVHGWDMDDLLRREHIRILLDEGIFDWCVILGPGRGQVKQILSLHEEAGERKNDGKRYTSASDSARLYLCGQNAFQRAQAKM